jgi:hypothetical protein
LAIDRRGEADFEVDAASGSKVSEEELFLLSSTAELPSTDHLFDEDAAAGSNCNS